MRRVPNRDGLPQPPPTATLGYSTMSGPEQNVINATIRALDTAGAIHFNIAAGNGETGLPDRHAIHRGRAIYMEFKRPGGGTVAPKQRWWLDRLAAAGGIALVVTDAQQVRDVLAQIDRESAANTVESGAQNGPALVVQPGPRHPNDRSSNAPQD